MCFNIYNALIKFAIGIREDVFDPTSAKVFPAFLTLLCNGADLSLGCLLKHVKLSQLINVSF